MLAPIHPFPARMAPELALQALALVPKDGIIVDPMVGSGTVLRQATDLGLRAFGFDLDPLAVLMSRVWTTPVNDARITAIYDTAQKLALAADPAAIELPWIDDDEETRQFIAYWFGKPQARALRCWAWAITVLSEHADANDRTALDVIRVALSRIIITKEQCASLARDTSHSRPHRTATDSPYCVYQGLDRSLKIVRSRLTVSPPSGGATVALGDARAINLQTVRSMQCSRHPPTLTPSTTCAVTGWRWFGFGTLWPACGRFAL